MGLARSYQGNWVVYDVLLGFYTALHAVREFRGCSRISRKCKVYPLSYAATNKYISSQDRNQDGEQALNPETQDPMTMP